MLDGVVRDKVKSKRIAAAAGSALLAAGFGIPGVLGDTITSTVYNPVQHTTDVRPFHYPGPEVLACGGLVLLLLWSRFRRPAFAFFLLLAALGSLGYYGLIWVGAGIRGDLESIDSAKKFITTVQYGTAFVPGLISSVLLVLSAALWMSGLSSPPPPQRAGTLPPPMGSP